MVFRGKKLSEVSEQDLDRLITEQVQERDALEYKRDMYGNSDDDKRELLKDITSMANHQGGYLLIGVDEDEEGVPSKLTGIEAGNHVERIRSICLDNVDKRIIGLDIEDISLVNRKEVVVVSIPLSIAAPHMITHKGLNQFWKRHGRQKDKMTIDEIGAAFEERASGMNRLDRFLFLRKAEILESVGGKTYMLLTASPVYVREEAVFHSKDEGLRKMMTDSALVGNLYSGWPYPTIHGLRADNHTPYDSAGESPSRTYIEVFSNGHIEFGKLFAPWGGNEPYFAGGKDTGYIVDFMAFIQTAYERYLPLSTLLVSFTIFNAKGMWLATSNWSGDDKSVKWQSQHLELGKFYVHDISADRKQVTKNICDRLWQAFHREECNTPL